MTPWQGKVCSPVPTLQFRTQIFALEGRTQTSDGNGPQRTQLHGYLTNAVVEVYAVGEWKKKPEGRMKRLRQPLSSIRFSQCDFINHSETQSPALCLSQTLSIVTFSYKYLQKCNIFKKLCYCFISSG